MEKTISINLKEGTCDISVKGLLFGHVKNLSAMEQAVAENLTSSLTLLGMEPEMVKEGVSLLLQGKIGIECILKRVP